MKSHKKKIAPRFASAFLTPGLRTALAVALAIPSLASAQLLHRYSFATDGTDSVGGATGSLVLPNGGPSASIGNGLTLPGNAGGGYGVAGYFAMPSGILTNTHSLTLEIWMTQNAAHTWAEIWDFASSTADNFGLIPDGGDRPYLEIGNPYNNEPTSGYTFPDNSEHYVTFTFNATNLTGTLYVDGAVLSSYTYNTSAAIPASIGGTGGTLHNMIGNDIWGDPQFSGTVYEFRIWNGVVSESYINATAIVGSGSVVSNLTPTSAPTVSAGGSVVVTGTEQAVVTVTLAATGSTPIVATSDATNWVSSNPNVIQVNSGGLIVGVAPGTATVSATVGGVTGTTAPITVTPQALQNRYSFAIDGTDSVGGATGLLVPPNGGSAASISNGLILPGNTHGTYGYSGYLSLPSGILTNTSSVTIECWATQNQGNTWAELWDFGNNGNMNFAFIPYPANNGNNMEVAFTPNGGEEDLQTSILYPSTNTTTTPYYTAVTYNNYSLQGFFYTNGYLTANTTFTSTNYCPGGIGGTGGTTENNLGNDVYGDDQFSGTVSEFRIWNGAVSPAYVAAAQAAGPAVVITNLIPTSLAIDLATNGMIGSGTQQATAVANLPQVSGVNLTPSATNWTSSNPTIVTVSSSGLITAVNGGTATVSATVNGVSATSATITVSSTPPDFTQSPVSQVVAVNDSVTLAATVLGGSLSYRWTLNSAAIPGATNSTLVLTNIQLSQGGTYTLTATNSRGSASASAVVTVNQANLLHRYSFAIDASDSVGGPAWNGTLVTGSSGSTVMVNDGAAFPGGSGSGVGGYVSFPTGILTNTSSLTIEVWVTQNQSVTWAELWSFNNGTGDNYGLIPDPGNNNGNMEIGTSEWGNNPATTFSFPNGTEQYVAYTFNSASLVGTLFDNGTSLASYKFPAGAIPASLGGAGGTTDNWLANDPYGGDNQFNGTVYEFRIWDGAVSPLYLALANATGSGTVVTNLTPNDVMVTVTNSELLPGQTENATVSADFTIASDLPATAYVTNWTSSSPSVLTVNSSGLITAVSAGTATVSATVYGTIGTSSSITVVAGPPVVTGLSATNVTLLTGTTLNLSVTATGSSPIVYSWYNGAALLSSQANNAALSVPNLTAGNVGNYTCVLSNTYGSVTSSPVSVSVFAPTAYQSALLSQGPLAFWPLNETSGTTAYDVVGGYNGTYNGNIGLAQPGPTNSFFGGASLAAQFDGSTTYVDIPEGPFNITGPITVMAWVNVTAANGFDGLFGHGDSSWRLSVNGSGDPGGNDGSVPADATSPTSIIDGNFHLVAYSYNGNPSEGDNGALYVDGVEQSVNSITPAPAGNGLDVWIGGAPDYPGARNINATIADAAIFDHLMTAAEVNDIYNATSVVLSPSTISIAESGSNVVLTWTNSATLLEAPTVSGPWTANSTATSPYTLSATNTQQYFKLLNN